MKLILMAEDAGMDMKFILLFIEQCISKVIVIQCDEQFSFPAYSIEQRFINDIYSFTYLNCFRHEEILFFALSNRSDREICIYPDSNKMLNKDGQARTEDE